MKSLIQTAGLLALLWGMSIPWAELCPNGNLWAAAGKVAPRTGAVQKLFRRGMEAYEAKAFDDAIDIFSQILQKQPDYVPAKIQLARTLYQMKRLTEAYRLFQQVDDISILEPDPSFEYGQAAFRVNDNQTALKAFRNIPNGHPLFDLAGYYGGITAFKLGEYQLSLDLFAQAVVLPSKLLKSLKLYQKEAERLLVQQQKQELQNSVPTTNKNNSGTDAPPEGSKPYQYLNAERKIELAPRLALQNRTNTERRATDHLIKAGTFKAAAGLDRVGASQKTLQWLLQGELSARSAEGGTQEVQFAPDINADQESFIINKSQARSLVGGGVFGGIEWSLSPGTSFGLIGGSRALVATAKEATRNAVLPIGGLFLAQKNSSLETLIKTDVMGLLLDNDFLYTEARQVGRIEFGAASRFRLSLQGDLSEFAYNVDRVNGPDWRGRILSEVGYVSERGIKSKLGAFFEINEAQRLHDLDNASILEFNYNAYGARFTASAPLGRYLDLSAEAWITERSTAGLNPANEATVYALRNDFPTLITTFALHINMHSGF